MTRALDVMTRSVAAVSPETPIKQAAALMRDLNIGDVLVVNDGKLVGIVTDRDLAIQVLPNGIDKHVPVKTCMTTAVVTGQPDWSLEQVAQVMGKYQIRRLPIVRDDRVIGIVSLGDVALHLQNPKRVALSLNDISEAAPAPSARAKKLFAALGIVLPLAVTAGMIVLNNRDTRRQLATSMNLKRWQKQINTKQLRKQWEASELPEKARATIQEAALYLTAPETRRAAWQTLRDAEIGTRTLKAADTVKQTFSGNGKRTRFARPGMTARKNGRGKFLSRLRV